MPTDIKTDSDLLKRLEAAARIEMTSAQVRSQRVSFVYGNLPSDSSMTRHEVEKALARLDGNAA